MNTIWQSLPLVETDDECKDISRNIEKWFDISSWDERRRKNPLSVEKNKKVTELIKDEKGGKAIAKIAAKVPKSYSYCEQRYSHEVKDSEQKDWKYW